MKKAKDVRGIGYTVDINEAKFRFLGNLILNLWDCGGFLFYFIFLT